MLIVIHVGKLGHNFLADIFGADSPIPIKTAEDGETLQRGRAYVAPADHHLLVIGETVRLGRGPRENMTRPAIDPLFRSVVAFHGPRAIAAVLTGTLNDGAAGLADVKRCGGTTVVQNPTDAFAQDMPRSALRATDVDYMTSLADMGRLLVTLAKQEAGPAVPIPEDIKTEVEIALGRTPDSDVLAELADPVAISCPACGGVLSQVRRSPPLRFRCQVGHAYTAEALQTQTEGSVDEAMRVAMRIMPERATLTEKMAEDARRSGLRAAAASYQKRVEESRAYVDILRQAINEI